MIALQKDIHIEAPIDRVFAYLDDPANFLEIWPSMMEVSNVRRAPNGGHRYDWVYKMAGMRFHGHAEATEYKKNEKFTVKNERGIPSTFHWRFSGDAHRTELHLEVEYTIPNPLLQKLAEPFLRKINDREADTLLANLKARMEVPAPN